jgi:putative colanic acid biosynthesis UDP-glucose lipid carrier transferase
MYAVHNRTILRRRNGVFGNVEALFDGISLIAIAAILIKVHIGVITFEYLAMLLLLLAILATAFDYLAIYRSNVSFYKKSFKLFQAWTISLLILTFIGFAFKQSEYFSRLLIGQLYLFGLTSHIVQHLLYRQIFKSWLGRDEVCVNALVIGKGPLAEHLADKINHNPWISQKIVGSMSLNGDCHTASQERTENSLRNLGDVSQLKRIIEEQNIRVAYIVTPLGASKVLEEVYFALLDQHISIHWVPDIFSLRLINHSVNEVAGIPVLTLSETPLTGMNLVLKAIEDKLLTLILLLLVSPVFLLIAIAIKCESPGPVFFRQYRTGWNGKKFSIWKFRSMYVHQADEGVLKQACRGDPRITRVGAILRRTSLDELPQLLNVLTGDMSLVGPRPHAIQHDREYSQRISDYFARHRIKPGITGLAQVRGLRGETREISKMAKRIHSDIEYINNWSVWLDLSILVRTFKAFTGKSAY